MGQKVNPIGLRIGVNKGWESTWFDEKNYANKLHEDIIIRNYINNKMNNASISNIKIERTPKKVNITINTARPGIVIGKGGEEVARLKAEVAQLTSKEVQVNISEIKRPELDAALVGANIAHQLQKKVSFYTSPQIR